MIERVVRGNTVFLKGATCQIQISTLPGEKILLRLIGNDHGEFGRIPFDELNDKLHPGTRIELFVDTSLATGVSPSVTDQWEKWFSLQRSKLYKINLFAPAKFFVITAGIMKELSGAGDMFQIYSDRQLFSRALGVNDWEISPERNNPPEVEKKVFPVQKIGGSGSAFHFIRLRPGVLFVKISGRDTGDNLEEVLNALTTELESFPGPLHLFVDAEDTRAVTARVSEKWTKWIADNKGKLLNIDVLSGSRLVTLIISAAKIFSRTGDLMNVIDRRSEFMEKMQIAAPGSEKLL